MNYYWLSRKYKQGGSAELLNEDVMQQVVALVQSALSGDQQAAQQIEQIAQAAQLGDPQAQQLMQVIEQVAQEMQGGLTEPAPEVAQKGAKLKKNFAEMDKANSNKAVKKLLNPNSKVSVNAKGAKVGCGCKGAMLHKVGGRIIEICE